MSNDRNWARYILVEGIKFDPCASKGKWIDKDLNSSGKFHGIRYIKNFKI